MSMICEFSKHESLRVAVNNGPFVSQTYNLEFSRGSNREPDLIVRVYYPQQARQLAAWLEEAAETLRRMADEEEPPAQTAPRDRGTEGEK